MTLYIYVYIYIHTCIHVVTSKLELIWSVHDHSWFGKVLKPINCGELTCWETQESGWIMINWHIEMKHPSGNVERSRVSHVFPSWIFHIHIFCFDGDPENYCHWLVTPSVVGWMEIKRALLTGCKALNIDRKIDR